MKPGFVIVPSRFGDKSKRTCQFYACCDNFREAWSDERGTQLECPICDAAVWAENETDSPDQQTGADR